MNDTHQLIRFDNSKELGSWYDQKYTEMGSGWKIGEAGANAILDWMGINEDTTGLLLDVGSGDGDFILTASKRIPCIGIDLSQVGVDYSNNMKLENTVFLVQDIETYQLLSPVFNYITSLGSIEHCIHIDVALNRVYSNLRDEGIFYILVPNEGWQHFDQPQETTHTDEEWIELFTAAGFKVKEQKRNNDLSEFLLVKDL